MKKTVAIILAAALALSMCACGGTGAAAPAPAQNVLDVMELIDAIPALAGDNSNADAVYDAYAKAQDAYFALDYADMGKVTNIGELYRAIDGYNAIFEAEDTLYAEKVAEAGKLLQGVWYDSSGVIDPDGYIIIRPDGSVESPYFGVYDDKIEVFTDGTYYIPYYGTIYPEYSMDEMRLASTEGYGCLISKGTRDEMFVTVELTDANIADYVCFDTVYSYVDTWGDTVSYYDNNQTSLVALDRMEGQGITFIGERGSQYEVKLSNGDTQTCYGLGQFVVDGRNLEVRGFGRARGTFCYVNSEYVWSKECVDGMVTVTLNDGTKYTYWHGDYAMG